jgi:5'-deoxynucleotidase YfbR-like HD superfamily hydrolase
MVASLVPRSHYKAALLHDAAEAYLGDVVKPLKALLGDYGRIEGVVTKLIANTFEVSFEDYGPIKKADWVALATEKRDLMPNSTEPWSYLKGVDAVQEILVPMGPQEAKSAFLRAWYSTTKAVI